MACKRNAEFVYRHALATSALMITLARQIGLPVEMIHEAGVAGLLMDAGVNLLPVDFEAHGGLPGSIPPHIWRDHVRFGHDFVLGGAFGEAISRAVLEHHERMDGTGYPSGMRGDELSLLGRMAAICDSFDNLLNGFEADHAMGPAEALAHMAGDEGARSGTAGRVYRRHGALSGGIGGGTAIGPAGDGDRPAPAGCGAAPVAGVLFGAAAPGDHAGGSGSGRARLRRCDFGPG
jgi:hypothetical protein